MVRVAIVDDHPIARHGIAAVFGPGPDFEVTAAVGSPAELPRTADGRILADVVVLDLYLDEGRPAFDAIGDLAVCLPVLVVSASRTPRDVLAAMRAGASGYVAKSADEGAYRAAIEAVVGGETYLSAQVADLLGAATDEQPPPPEQRLAPREREVLDYIARGYTHRQTARRMGISAATVDTYVARIRAKLGLGNKAELTAHALGHDPRPEGWPPPSDGRVR